MTILRGGYVGAKNCTGGPQPGTKNLMAVFLERYAGRGARNLGIYNCRPVRGTNNTTSLHGEGRAGDHGCPVGNDWMQAWCDFLVAHSAELGIQCVIYNRRIWSSSYPDGWRPYPGAVPHIDHAHVEQTWASARTLTVARVRELLAPPAPAVPVVGLPVIREGAGHYPRGTEQHDATRRWQEHLRKVYPAYRHESPVKRGQLIDVDGSFGEQTEAWTRLFQQKSRIGIDGVVGPQTWRTARLA